MASIEQEMQFTPEEQNLFHLQQALIRNNIPQEVIDEAQRLVRNRRAEGSTVDLYAMTRKIQPNMERLHYVQWEERVANKTIYGDVGRLKFSEDDEYIQCHLCGGWFQMITGSHLSAHGLGNAEEYRKLVGLNRNTPLVSPDLGRRLSDEALGHDSGQYIDGKGTPFSDDNRWTGTRRMQTAIDRTSKAKRRREEGVLPPAWSGDRARRRLNNTGSFSFYNKDYYFDVNAANGYIEIISVTPDEFTVRGIVDGVEITKTIPRNDV